MDAKFYCRQHTDTWKYVAADEGMGITGSTMFLYDGLLIDIQKSMYKGGSPTQQHIINMFSTNQLDHLPLLTFLAQWSHSRLLIHELISDQVESEIVALLSVGTLDQTKISLR